MVSGETPLASRRDARLASNDGVEVVDRQLADNFTDATTNSNIAQPGQNVDDDVKYRQRWISRFDNKNRVLPKQDSSPALSDITNESSSLRNVQNGRTGAYGNNIAQGTDNVKYKIDPERALNTLKNFDDVLNGRKQSVVISDVSPQLAERIYQATGVAVNPNAEYELNRNNAIHISNRHISKPSRY